MPEPDADPTPSRRSGWLHREATWARAARRRRREFDTARQIDRVTHADPPEPVRMPLLELARFWAWPLVAIVGATTIGVLLVLADPGLARNLGVSMLAGVVAAVVVIPTQVVLARRAAQAEFERDGRLVQLAVDRVLEEVEKMLDRRAGGKHAHAEGEDGDAGR